MTEPIKASVVLCTFNGATHLPALLESLLLNGDAIGELLAFDDGSSDSTVELLSAWTPRFGGRMRVVVNPERLGPARNFSTALAQARGLLVLPCDQDDRWHADKVSMLIRVFEEDASALVVQHDAALIDADSARLGGTVYRRLRATARGDRARLLRLLLRRNRCPGCTLAVRRDFLVQLLPVPSEFMHDEWIALNAAALGGLRQIGDQLIDYRLHAGNTLGFADLGARRLIAEAGSGVHERRGAKLRRLQLLQEKLNRAFGGATLTMARLLEEAIDHRRARQALPASRWRRLPTVWRELVAGRYRRHASGLPSAVTDLLRSGERITRGRARPSDR